MQFFVIFTPNKKFETEGMPADFADLELREQAQVRVLYAGGGARQVWALKSPDGKILGGTILFEAESREHLQEMIDSFPLVQADYAGYQILTLAPHAAFMPKS